MFSLLIGRLVDRVTGRLAKINHPCQKDKNSVIWFYKKNKRNKLFFVFPPTGKPVDWQTGEDQVSLVNQQIKKRLSYLKGITKREGRGCNYGY